MSADALPEPDRVEGAAHPRETARLFGQAAAEKTFLAAVAAGRLHHGWLITGPHGVGKATLAWRIARFLLAGPPGDAPSGLDVAADHPVARRIAALSEPRLHLVRRGANERGDALSADIRLPVIRGLRQFLSMSAAEGGRRVVIVDAADELNMQAANALLKLLEEPPRDTVLLLVSHQPSGLLPTIRSRCRVLRLNALGPGDMAAALAAAGQDDPDAAPALAALSGGSVGAALRLARMDGLARYRALIDTAATLPDLDRARAIAFADSVAGRGAAAQLDLVLWLIDLFVSRLARAGVSGPPQPEAAPGEAALLARLAPDAAAARRWAELHEHLTARGRHGRAVNLDPAALVLDMVLSIAAAATPARAS